MYLNCCICGLLSDDGCLVENKGKRFHICLDCSENLTDEEIIVELDKKRLPKPAL